MLKTEGTRRHTDKRFRKEVYTCKDPELDGTVIIHYMGDSSLSVPFSHGNSKVQTKIFIRTKPSAVTDIEEKIKSNTEKSAHKHYKELVSEKKEGSEFVSKPRNTRQIHYQREKFKSTNRPSRCALINLHMLAYEDVGFVHCIRTLPDLVVVCGLEEILAELAFVLENVPKREQLLSYDTTFSMGDFYVSVLLFKHCCFLQKPIIPALFMIHERKLQEHHQVVFRLLREKMKGKLNMAPVAIDMEQGIKGAIETETPLYIVGCWRHLIKDIEAWALKNEKARNDSKKLVNDVFDILRTTSKVDRVLEEKKSSWPPDFQHYFQKQIEDRLPNYCLQYIHKYTNADDINGVTTNQSEGFNWLIKDLNNWKEGPIDCILLSFRFLQQYYLSEIRRGKAAIGNFTLISSMVDQIIDVNELDIQPAVCDVKEIVEFIKNKDITDNTEVMKEEINLTVRGKAKEIVAANRISFVPRFGSFVILGATGQSFVSKLFPKETCTCALKHGKCSHVLAVKMALRMDTTSHEVVQDLDDITKTRKEVRGKKKPGRKQPRPGDTDPEPESSNIKTPLKRVRLDHEQIQMESPNLTERQEEQSMRRSIDAVNEDLWLVNSDGIHLNLTNDDRLRLKGSLDNGWLNDIIIDASQSVLRQQFPHEQGMQSVLYAAKPEFQPASGPFVQIVNTHPNDGGLHWVCFSNFNCDAGVVNLYDSAGGSYISAATEMAIANIMFSPMPKIFVRHLKCSEQTNSNDCGVYAIANMVSILNGIDPSGIRYTVPKMRDHLIKGLEAKNITAFPHRKLSNVKQAVLKVTGIPLFCTCRMPDSGFMFTCSKCQKWFHPKCQNITQSVRQVKLSKTIKCLDCRS